MEENEEEKIIYLPNGGHIWVEEMPSLHFKIRLKICCKLFKTGHTKPSCRVITIKC
jgi:hypothetical protein